MSFNLTECPHCNTTNPAVEAVKIYKSNFTTCTCCSREKPHRVVHFENPLYRKLCRMVADRMNKIWEVRFDWRYTDHSPYHSARIIKWGEDLMAPLMHLKHENVTDKFELQAEEMLLFTLAAYMHDAAMQYIDDDTREDIEKIRDINREQEEEDRKKISEKDDVKKKDRLGRLNELHESVRKRHAERAPEVVVKIMNEIVQKDDSLRDLVRSLLKPLKYICRFHSGKKDKLKDLELRNNCCITGKQIDTSRIRMLAGILRFADELDLDRNRVTNLFVLENFPLGAYSSLHWIKHALIDSAYIENYRIKIDFSHPRLSGGDEERKKELNFYKQIAYWVKAKLKLEWEFIKKMDMILVGSDNRINPILPSKDSYKDDLDEDMDIDPFKPFEGDKKTKIREILKEEIKEVWRELKEISKVPEPPLLLEEEKLSHKILSVEMKPVSHLDILKDIGIERFITGQMEESEKILTLVYDKIKDDTNVIFTLANIYFAKNEYEKAIEFYEKSLQIEPKDHSSLNNVGLAYNNIGRFEKAIECYQKALEIKSDKYISFYNMGNAYRNIGAFEEAIKFYEKTLEIKPDYYEVLNNLGTTYEKLSQHEKAIENYHKALEIKSDFENALYNLGVTYGNMGKYEKAIECYEKALSIKPDYHEAFYNIGCIYGNLGNHMKAIKYYVRAIEVKSDKYEAMINMGKVFEELGTPEKALIHYKNALEIKPDSYEVLYNIGTVYGKLGQYNNAIESLKKAIEIKPDSYKALNNICSVLIKLEQYQEAIEHLKKAVAISPDSYELIRNLGVIYGLTHQHKKAIEYLDRAIELKPDDYEALNNMGVSYSKMGKYDDAIEYHKKALSIKPDYYNATYNLACVHSLKYGQANEKDPSNPSEEDLNKALEFLKNASEGDRKFRDMAKTDKDFEVIRDNPRFKEIIGDI